MRRSLTFSMTFQSKHQARWRAQLYRFAKREISEDQMSFEWLTF